MGRLIRVGNLSDLTPEKVRALRARLERNGAADVYDAVSGEMDPAPAPNPLTALMPAGVSALAERLKWQTWLALAAGALLALIAAAAIWWWTKSSEAESKRKVSVAKARALARKG